MNNSPITDQNLMDKSMRSVFVGNIPYEATEENLKDIFSEVGPVLSFKLVYDRETGKPKGYGFCEYKDTETAHSAMRNLNSYEIGGRTLRVDNACTEKSRMEMQSLLQGQNTENPYGEFVQSDKAPEAISKAVASLPPEQMCELMKQIKLCIQNNPNEARQMLLQNPQLAYALLQAQVVMKIVDPHTAVSMLQKANPIPPILLPNDKPSTFHNNPPPRIEEPWATINRPPPAAVSMLQKANPVPPLLLPNEKPSTLHNNPPPRIEEPWATINRPPPVINPPTPIFAGQDVDLRTLDRQMDPRLARMDQDLRTQPVIQPAPVVAPVIPPIVDNRAAFSLPDNAFSRDPRGDRFGRDPRDPRMPVDPRMSKVNPTPVTTVPPPVPRPVVAPVVPAVVPNTMTSATPPSGLSSIASSTATSRLMAGMSPAGNIPSGASDQEKAALIMQVLQLSDEQISMLPPEQRQSILVLKEQIAKSTQR